MQSPGLGSQVWFCSPLEGWAEVFDPDGMHIYRTVDGGVSWHRTSSDPPAAALFDPAPAFRIGGEAWFAAESQPGATLFVTRDGGASWNTILLIPPYCCGPGSEQTAYATSVRIVGETSIVAFIANERFGIPQTMVSGDDGLSWTTADLPVDGAAPDEVTLLDTDHWWVFNSNAVYVTDDGGRSWIYARDFDFGTNWRPGKAGGIDATHAWRSLTSTANSQVAALAVTADGGSHWRLVNAPQP